MVSDLDRRPDAAGLKEKEANWLPAPEGEFIPMLRMYWPKESNPSILDGTWIPPEVVKVNLVLPRHGG